jgi:hypothetical protein
MKKYTFGGPKGKNSPPDPPEPKNGISMKTTKTLYFYFEFLEN